MVSFLQVFPNNKILHSICYKILVFIFTILPAICEKKRPTQTRQYWLKVHHFFPLAVKIVVMSLPASYKHISILLDHAFRTFNRYSYSLVLEDIWLCTYYMLVVSHKMWNGHIVQSSKHECVCRRTRVHCRFGHSYFILLT